MIGTWGGYEDNHFYRRDGQHAVEDAVHRCEVGETITLTATDIHEVVAPADGPSAALRVYGGALFDEPRSAWTGNPPTEHRVDDAAVLDGYLDAMTQAGLTTE